METENVDLRIKLFFKEFEELVTRHNIPAGFLAARFPLAWQIVGPSPEQMSKAEFAGLGVALLDYANTFIRYGVIPGPAGIEPATTGLTDRSSTN